MTYEHPLLLVFSVLTLAGFIRLRHCKRKGLALVGVVGLFLLYWPPVEWLVSRPLEGQYPVRPFQAPADVRAVVIFSEGVSPPIFQRPYPQASLATAERCEYGAWIHKTQRPLPVLACGGRSSPQDPPYSAGMRELLRRAGVPDALIWTEEQSHNTHENALYGAEILRAHGINRVVLVVDARSMPRAAAALKKQGIDVVPAPSRFREWQGPRELLPEWAAIRGNEETLHEILGLAWYRFRGWI